MKNKFIGKFRGEVTDNLDPLMIGRVRARVPDVFGADESGWAMPCLPFTGSGVGFFAVPIIGARVWIEFEHGDSEYPIWTGGFWGTAADVPPEVLVPPPPSKKIFIKTEGGHSILLDDTPGIGGITLQTSGGQKIAMTAISIEINDGQGGTIKFTGPKVSINDGAIDVI